MAKTTKPTKPNAEQLEAAKLILQQAGYSLTAGKTPTKAQVKASAQATKAVEKAARTAAAEKARKEFEQTVIAEFAKHGFKAVKPRVDVKTLKLWQDAGYVLKGNQRPVMCPAPWTRSGPGYAMYHVSQMAKAS